MRTGEDSGEGATSFELPGRFDLASASPVAERVTELKALFPEAVREDRVDLDSLSRTIGDWVDPGPERFGLMWPGKAECMRVVQQPSVGTLLATPDDSVNFDTTQNLIIEGDNLEVLKLLQKSYYGSIKVIYIDPPYNTGRDFIYPDNFREGLAGYLRYSGQVDADGVKFSANTETDGRYHSKWLSMMYPRLFVASNLLSDDGLIFVSIDDHEVHNLRSMMSEIFGEEAFVGTMVWQAKKGGGSDNAGLVNDHEYVMVFARSAEALALGKVTFESAPLDRNDEKGRYRRGRELNKWGSNSLRADRPTMYFPIPGPDGEDVYPIRTDGKEGRWRKGKPEMLRLSAEGEIDFAVRSDGRIGAFEKVRDESPATKPFRTWLTDVGTTADGTKRIKALFSGSTPFPYPKPVELLESIIAIGVGAESDATVLDFFAGSGSMGDAVISYNSREGANLQYILVQLPEESGEGGQARELSSIARERMRLVGQEQSNSLVGQSLDSGFRSYRLTSSNFVVWNGDTADGDALKARLLSLTNNVVDGRAQSDLLTELLLKAGYPLTASVAELTLAGKRVYSVDDNSLFVCLEPKLSIEVFEAMADLSPGLILVLDAGFADDELKMNALQTVRSRRSDSQGFTELKVI